MEQIHKHSRKRDAILDCVRSTKCHPSAEWVYKALKPEIPDLSLGTVYRNLAFFREEGLIRSIGTINGFERFDGTISNHAHFICTCCGSVLDLPEAELPPALLGTLQQEGCTVTAAELRVCGRCAGCGRQKTGI